MGLTSWIKKRIAGIAFATSNVEKAALGQDGGSELGNGSAQHQRHRQGSLADALNKGEVTKEVQELRWRMYKVLEESQKHRTKIVGYDEDGFMITETDKDDGYDSKTTTLSKINVDDFDDYPLELVVNNDKITLSKNDISEGKVKQELVISCARELRAKFEIEDYTKKMNVRTISETEKLLEFYVSIYPDEYNRKSRFFLSEIGKAIKNPRMCDFLDISNVMFVSYNTIGVKDLMAFNYKITNFDKIVDYNGYHVIKFKAEVVTNGESIYEKYKEGAEELIEKYKNNEKKDNGFN